MHAMAYSSTTTGVEPIWPSRRRLLVDVNLTSTQCASLQSVTSRSRLKGVDVFGRGTYGGGGFNSRTAAEAAIQAGLSTGDMQ